MARSGWRGSNDGDLRSRCAAVGGALLGTGFAQSGRGVRHRLAGGCDLGAWLDGAGWATARRNDCSGAGRGGGTRRDCHVSVAHFGQRPFGAVVDPDPRVSGRGFAKLAAAGIEVTQGVCEQEARALNAGFFKRIEKGRPLVALKIAESSDGYVADASGKTRWITSERARRHGHLLRAKHDAIMVGIGTVLADDPLLTCRLEGLEHRSPTRIVVDSKLRLAPSSQLARTARHTPVLVFTAATAGGETLTALGVEIVRADADALGRVDLAAVLRALAARGLTRLLVEGGPELHGSFLKLGLADVVYRYTAPLVLGAGLRSAFPATKGDAPANAPHFTFQFREAIGPDLLESFRIAG